MFLTKLFWSNFRFPIFLFAKFWVLKNLKISGAWNRNIRTKWIWVPEATMRPINSRAIFWCWDNQTNTFRNAFCKSISIFDKNSIILNVLQNNRFLTNISFLLKFLQKKNDSWQKFRFLKKNPIETYRNFCERSDFFWKTKCFVNNRFFF